MYYTVKVEYETKRKCFETELIYQCNMKFHISKQKQDFFESPQQ